MDFFLQCYLRKILTAFYEGYVHNSLQNYNYVGKYTNKTLDFTLPQKKF